MPSEWRTPAAKIGIAGVLVAAVGIVVAIVVPNGDVSDSGHISACRKDHGAPTEQRQSDYSTGKWADCSWPPAEGTASDGFGVATLKRIHNDPNASTSSYQGVDVYESDCAELTVKYRHDRQVSVIGNALTADVGQVRELVFAKAGSKMRLEPAALPAFVDLELDRIADNMLVIVVPYGVAAEKVACS